jgi:hypothetical protein
MLDFVPGEIEASLGPYCAHGRFWIKALAMARRKL